MVVVSYRIEERNVISSVGRKPGHDITHRLPLDSIVECNVSHGHHIDIVILALGLRIHEEFLHVRNSFSSETVDIRIGLALRVPYRKKREILLRSVKRFQKKIIPVLFAGRNS